MNGRRSYLSYILLARHTRYNIIDIVVWEVGCKILHFVILRDLFIIIIINIFMVNACRNKSVLLI